MKLWPMSAVPDRIGKGHQHGIILCARPAGPPQPQICRSMAQAEARQTVWRIAVDIFMPMQCNARQYNPVLGDSASSLAALSEPGNRPKSAGAGVMVRKKKGNKASEPVVTGKSRTLRLHEIKFGASHRRGFGTWGNMLKHIELR
jgi:hypothetical protein